MGLRDRFEKLKQATSQIKEELEERGVLGSDQQRAQHQAPAQSSARSAEDSFRETAAAEGRPDPFTLASTAEVAALLGIEVEDPTCGYADYEFGPKWRGRGFKGDQPSVWLAMYTGELGSATPEQASSMFREYSTLADEPTPMAGVGDEAAWSGDVLYFRVGRDLFYLYASRYGHEVPTNESVAELARTVADRAAGR